MKRIFLSIAIIALLSQSGFLYAGNPDRQGEAGAYELLLNPWARTSGLNNLAISNVSGVEAMFLNPAGLAKFNTSMQVVGAHTRYLVGSGMALNSVGFAKKIGDNAFGISITNVDFGDIPITTTDQPEGTGVNFKPLFLNIAVSYNHVFSKKISVALTGRVVTESISNATASAVCFDAGVQYVTGPDDNIHFGVSLKNVGTKMKFGGDGLAYFTDAPRGTQTLTVFRGPSGFNLPSQFNIGAAYDFLMAEKKHRLTTMASFSANSFTRDRLGIGAEYAFREQFMLRAAYAYESQQHDSEARGTLDTGLSIGAGIYVPMKKESDRKFGVDYSYRTTYPYEGTHTFSLRLDL